MGLAGPVAVAALLAGCGQGSGTGTSVAEQSAAKLTVTVHPNKSNAQTKQWTLTCQPAGGTHPTPKKACKALSSAKRPFQPPPKGQECTMIYGGPQTATVKGTWHGQQVSATYGRGNGCELTQWKALNSLLTPKKN